MDVSFFPFCSQRCKNIDLNRWFAGAYVIPGEESEKNDQSNEKFPRQKIEISLYDVTKSPDSSVGRAED